MMKDSDADSCASMVWLLTAGNRTGNGVLIVDKHGNKRMLTLKHVLGDSTSAMCQLNSKTIQATDFARFGNHDFFGKDCLMASGPMATDSPAAKLSPQCTQPQFSTSLSQVQRYEPNGYMSSKVQSVY